MASAGSIRAQKTAQISNRVRALESQTWGSRRPVARILPKSPLSLRVCLRGCNADKDSEGLLGGTRRTPLSLFLLFTLRIHGNAATIGYFRAGHRI